MKNVIKKMVALRIIYLLMVTAFLNLAVALAAETATVSLDTTTWRQGTNISLSVTGNITSIVVSGSASNTANSSSVALFTITNSSATNLNRGKANYTLNAGVAFEDSSVASITAIARNSSTTTIGTMTATTATIDRTAPTAPTSLSPSGLQTSQDQTFNVAVTGASTTSCTLNFLSKNPGNAIYAMSHSGSTCSLSINNLPNSVYDYTITATDGLNSSTSSTSTLNINKASQTSKAGAVAVAVNQGKVLSVNGALVSTQSSGNAKEWAKNEFTMKEGKKTGIGVAGGVVVGTFLFPGIGTVAGAVIGGLIGLVV